jgi:hypothetical protein
MRIVGIVLALILLLIDLNGSGGGFERTFYGVILVVISAFLAS